MENVDFYRNLVGRRVEKPNIQRMLVVKQTHTCIRRILVKKTNAQNSSFWKPSAYNIILWENKGKQYVFVGKRTHENVCLFTY